MRAWILFPIEPPTDDRAYLLGHLTAIFDHLAISRVGMFAERAPEAPDGIDLIIGWTRTRSRRILDHLDEIAGELGIPISNPPEPMWRAIDKRCYLEDYPEFIPRTLIAEDMTGLRKAWDALGGDVVVKDPFGDRGQQVERVRSKADFALAERLLAVAFRAQGITSAPVSVAATVSTIPRSRSGSACTASPGLVRFASAIASLLRIISNPRMTR